MFHPAWCVPQLARRPALRGAGLIPDPRARPARNTQKSPLSKTRAHPALLATGETEDARGPPFREAETPA